MASNVAAISTHRTDTQWPSKILQSKAQLWNHDVKSEHFAYAMDNEDPLSKFRLKFHIPIMQDLPCVDQKLVNLKDECIYLCGNSLGLQPKSAEHHMTNALKAWAKWGVLSHFNGDLPAFSCDSPGIPTTAQIIGAKPNEVALMNGLTVNLNLLLVSFYKPNTSRFKILMEAQAFPSDRFAIKSQIRHRGYDPESALIQLAPREGEHCLRTEDILKVIETEGDSISIILFAGVQFYTGQKFEMKRITDAGHSKGCFVGFDLAHAVGNVKLNLHEWDVDFACWCSYKYLNSGAGGLAGAFIHEKHNATQKPELQGWWSNVAETRFEMKEDPDLDVGVAALRLSNPPPWLACLNIASLEIFEETSIDELVAKQFLLTGYLELLLDAYFISKKTPMLKIITPRDPQQRGCQLSLLFFKPIDKVHEQLEKRGVLCDIRKPNVLRITPIPLYTTFYDVYKFVHLLVQILNE